MVNFLETFLPIVIYILLIVLIIIGIILGIRAIKTLNRIDRIVDDVDKKVKAFDGLFNVVDVVSDKFSLITNKVVDGVSGLIGKIFTKNDDDDDDYDEEDE